MSIETSQVSTDVQRGYRLMLPYFEDEWRPDDMEHIAAIGATTVVFCLSERDIVERDRDSEIVKTINVARDTNLEVVADLWGVGKIFGGEAPSKLREADRCPDSPVLQQLIRQGTSMAADYGADTMFWDEPHLQHCSCHGSKEVDFIRQNASYAAELGLQNSTCLTPGSMKEEKSANMQKLEELASSPDIASIGTDPYYTNFPGEGGDTHERYIGKFARQVKDIAAQSGKRGHIWVQGFGLPFINIGQETPDMWRQRASSKPWEDVPLEAAAVAIRHGITDIGIWASREWRCSAKEITTIAPPFPERVWENAARIAGLLRES